MGTPVPQRRSTRIACKKFSENEEKDSSQIHSALNLNKRKSARLQQRQQNEQNNDIQHELNGNSNSTENHWKGRLRHKQTKNMNISTLNDDEEIELKNNKAKDSDYGQNEFEQDCQHQDDDEEEEEPVDSPSDYFSDRMGRRRSSRLSKKPLTHYYNDGSEITRDAQNVQNDDNTKSGSLPLSLRRTKRNIKPPVNTYEVAQYNEYEKSMKLREERRISLRRKKAVNYAESPGSNDSDCSDSDDPGTATRSPSKYRKRRKRRTTSYKTKRKNNK